MPHPARSLVLILLSAVCWSAQAGPVLASTRYAVTPVVTGNAFAFVARGINNAGDVVGTVYVDDAGAEQRGYVFSGGLLRQLPTLGGLGSNPFAINDAGQIAGSSQGADGVFHAALFSAAGVINLTPTMSRESGATALNGAGIAVGAIPCACFDSHAARFADGAIRDLGTLGGASSSAYGINSSGQIVGFAALAGPYTPRAFLYEDGVMRDIGSLGGEWASAQAINEAGNIAGSSDRLGGQPHAFLYVDGVMTDLGALGDGSTAARGLNSADQVVGVEFLDHEQRGFVWDNGTMFDLNALLDPASGWRIDDAAGINDFGQIVASGCHDTLGLCGILRLDPRMLSAVPEPGTWLMLALGLAVVIGGARRRRHALDVVRVGIISALPVSSTYGWTH